MIVCVCYLTWHDYPYLVEGENIIFIILSIIIIIIIININ